MKLHHETYPTKLSREGITYPSYWKTQPYEKSTHSYGMTEEEKDDEGEALSLQIADPACRNEDEFHQ